MTDEDRLPVVVAAGQALERSELVTALELAGRAVEAALEGTGGLRSRVGVVSVVNILSRVGPSPAGILARRAGLGPVRTEVTTVGGNSPQWLVNRAAAAIAGGSGGTFLIAGAEAQRSSRVRREQRALGDDSVSGPGTGTEEDAGLPPDEVVGDDRPGMGPAEVNAGLVAPVHVYPLFESALAHQAGRDPAAQREFLGTVLAPFTEVAAGNPWAWFPEVRTPAELSEVTAENRLVAEPYPKRMCAVMGVDQAACLVVTSLGTARALGLAQGAVFCWSGADAADVWFPSARPDPGRSPGIAAAAGAALGAAGIGPDELSSLDLYSCFPCALELAAEAIGISLDDHRGLTVTGGLPYFGGPGNNYTLHAIATMVERLGREGGTGLVTGLGWYATKHSVGIYGGSPPVGGWAPGETGPDQARIDAGAVVVAGEVGGRAGATVLASTVVAGPDGSPAAAPVIARLDDGRQVAAAAEETELAGLAGLSLVGHRVEVSGGPPRYRVAG